MAQRARRQLRGPNAALERQATLGRYVLEMRHNLNNALTSLLGNSELLLLEPGALSAEARPQVEDAGQAGHVQCSVDRLLLDHQGR